MSESRPVIKASFDGACQPFNPGGHIGPGWVIGKKDYHEFVAARADNSNNVAEYMALNHLLEEVAAFPKPGVRAFQRTLNLIRWKLAEG
jgi:ribonuclease HI